jgi:conjugal transfer ATP-binding protein TraC
MEEAIERVAYPDNPEKWTDPSAEEPLAIAAE